MRFIEADENLSLRGAALKEAIEEDIKNGLIPFWVILYNFSKNYPTHVKLVADPKSFRKATREMSDEQNKMGWMMTM